MTTFEGGAQKGNPFDRLRKWIRINLCTINRRVVATQGHLLFFFFSDDEEIVGWVDGENLGVEREWRDTPPLNRLLTRGRWEAKETESPLFHGAESNEIPAGGRDKMPFKVQFPGQFVNRLHRSPHV